MYQLPRIWPTTDKTVVHLEGDMQLILLYYELHNSLVGCASLISQSFKNNKKVVYTLYQYIFLCVRPHVVIIVEPNWFNFYKWKDLWKASKWNQREDCWQRWCVIVWTHELTHTVTIFMWLLLLFIMLTWNMLIILESITRVKALIFIQQQFSQQKHSRENNHRRKKSWVCNFQRS